MQNSACQNLSQDFVDRLVFDTARKFLLNRMSPKISQGVDPEAVLARHLAPDLNRPDDLRPLYRRLLISATHAAHKEVSIPASIPGGIDSLSKVTFDFDPVATSSAYGTDPAVADALIDRFVAELGLRGGNGRPIRRQPNSDWPRYIRTMISGAAYLSSFGSASAMYEFFDGFYLNPARRDALPVLVAHAVEGVGVTLACDWLKEIGFVDYSKLDTHLKDILSGIGLLPASADDEDCQRVMRRLAAHNGVDACAADHVFWIIGSGKFYRGEAPGAPPFAIGQRKQDFIALCQARMAEQAVTA